VDPLEWNETLAEASERWVENCVWEHSGGKLLEGGYGENLFGEFSLPKCHDKEPSRKELAHVFVSGDL